MSARVACHTLHSQCPFHRSRLAAQLAPLVFRGALSVALAGCIAPPATAQFCGFTLPFHTYVNGPGTSPQGLAIADFDGDGRLDFIVGIQYHVIPGEWFLGNGNGGFPRVGFLEENGLDTNIVVGPLDANGDGKPDLVLLHRTAAGVGVAVNTTNYVTDTLPSFQVRDCCGYSVEGDAIDAAIADFNADGGPDIAVAVNNTNNVVILLNNPGSQGQQMYRPAQPSDFHQVGSNPSRIRSGDLNGDGKTDLAVLCGFPRLNSIWILLGTGIGGFQPLPIGPFTPDPNENVRDFLLGDFNGDGTQDIILCNEQSSSLTMWANNGQVTFHQTAVLPTSLAPQFVTKGDFNADGRLDLGVSSFTSSINESSFVIFVGHGDGTFAHATSISVPNPFGGPFGAFQLGTADFNTDGASDIASVSAREFAVAVFLRAGSGFGTRYVNHAATGVHDGQTWATAYNDLQDALDEAGTTPCIREIWVAEGTYTPTGFQGPRNATFQIPRHDLAIYGGFAGTEVRLEDRDIAANRTVLSGDLNGDDLPNGDINLNDNAYHVVTADGVGTTAILDGFTIRGGHDWNGGSMTAPDAGGAGLLIVDASPTIRQCEFVHNSAAGGGATHISGASDPLFEGCTFGDNRALATPEGGGAAFVALDAPMAGESPHSVEFRACVFDSNDASTTQPAGNGQGGAIRVRSGELALVACTFQGNSADVGGAVNMGGGPAPAARLRAVSCDFVSNSARNQTAAIYASGSNNAQSSLDGCVFALNHVVRPAGVVATACIYVGIYTTLEINDCTFAGNYTSGPGAAPDAALYVNGESGGGATAHLRNCVLWENRNGASGNPAYGAQVGGGAFGSITFDHCIIQGWTGGKGTTNGLDPRFMQSPGPGLDLAWGTSDDDRGDLRLGPGSSAIDSGNTFAVPPDVLDVDGDGNTTESLPLDVAGRVRFFDDPNAPNTGAGNPPVDRGAYENYLVEAIWTAGDGGRWDDPTRWAGALVANAFTSAVFGNQVVDPANPSAPVISYNVSIGADREAYSLAVEAKKVTLNLRQLLPSPATNGSLALLAPPSDTSPALLIGSPLSQVAATLELTNTAGPLRGLSFTNGAVAPMPGTHGDLFVRSWVGTQPQTTFPPRVELLATGLLDIGAGGMGRFVVDRGSIASVRSLRVGGAGGTGAAEVKSDLTGVTSSLFVGSGPGSSLALGGGNQGTGGLHVSDAGVFVGDKLESVTLGSDPSSTGTLMVTDSGSSATISAASLKVGEQGTGSIVISGGGTLDTYTSSGIRLAEFPGSHAHVSIMGPGSTWRQHGQFMFVGGAGDATITIGGGGSLAFVEAGRLVINPTGTLNGSGVVSAPVINVGLIDVGGPTGALQVEGDYEQLGLVQLSGAPNATPVSGSLRVLLEATALDGAPRGGRVSANIGSLAIGGQAELGGSLLVHGNPGMLPLHSVVTPLTAAGGVVGGFDVAFLPGFPDTRFLRVGSAQTDIGASVTLTVEQFGFPLNIHSGNTTAPGLPSGVAVGDLNGDGFADVALTIPSETPGGNGSVAVLLSEGTTGPAFGGFSSATQFSVGREPSALVIADLVGAGGLDIAVANKADNSVTVLQNNGSGVFATAGSIVGLSAPVAISAARLNDDARVDLVVANEGDDSLSTFVSADAGGGQFNPGPRILFAAGSMPTSTGEGDLENDKDIEDVVVALANSSQVAVLRNITAPGVANPAFDPPVLLDVGTAPVQVFVTDLHAGGQPGNEAPEILTVNASGSISILRNMGDGQFAPFVDLEVGADASSITALDLDGDVDLDIAIVAVPDSGAPAPTVRILRNAINGGSQLAFESPTNFSSGITPLFVDRGDVDGNSTLDLITIQGEPIAAALRDLAASRRAVTLGHGDTDPTLAAVLGFMPGDTNGDHLVNFLDLNIVLGDFGGPPSLGVSSDLDLDGLVDFVDLNVVLSFYGRGNQVP